MSHCIGCHEQLSGELLSRIIGIVENQFVCCSKDCVASEIIPIQYGAPMMFAILAEDISIEPATAQVVQVEIQVDPK